MPMPRRIRFYYPDEDITALAVLLTDAAPATCHAIVEALPFEGLARHGIYSGSETLMFIPPDVQPPRENAISRVRPGDIGYYSFEEQASPDGRQPVAEIAWFYDTNARPSMADGPVAVNLFARFDEGFDQVVELCYRMRTEGAKRLQISAAP